MQTLCLQFCCPLPIFFVGGLGRWGDIMRVRTGTSMRLRMRYGVFHIAFNFKLVLKVNAQMELLKEFANGSEYDYSIPLCSRFDEYNPFSS
jgi:hypothetical protein